MMLLKCKFYVERDYLHSNQNNSAPFLLCQRSHARKSKQMKEDKRSAVTRGWMPLVLERLSWFIVTWTQKVSKFFFWILLLNEKSRRLYFIIDHSLYEMRLQGIMPCIRLARLKFELTDQDSVGGKNITVLTLMYVDKKSIEIRPLFSLEMTLNIHGKGFTIPKTVSGCKKWKISNILSLQGSNLVPKMGRWHSAGSSSSVAR